MTPVTVTATPRGGGDACAVEWDPAVESRGDALERLARVALDAPDDTRVGWQVDSGIHHTPESWVGTTIEYIPTAGAWSTGLVYRVEVDGETPDDGLDPAALMRSRRMRSEGSRLWDTTAVAERLGVKPETVSSYLARGMMPAPDGRYGRAPVWREDTVEAWIASRPGMGNRTPRKPA